MQRKVQQKLPSFKETFGDLLSKEETQVSLPPQLPRPQLLNIPIQNEKKNRKVRWTKQEDELLLKLYLKYKTDWENMTKYFCNRPACAIKNRFYFAIRKRIKGKIGNLKYYMNTLDSSSEEENLSEETFEGHRETIIQLLELVSNEQVVQNLPDEKKESLLNELKIRKKVIKKHLKSARRQLNLYLSSNF